MENKVYDLQMQMCHLEDQKKSNCRITCWLENGNKKSGKKQQDGKYWNVRRWAFWFCSLNWEKALLTSSGADNVTVGELRLRGRLIWGSLRWLLLLVVEPVAPSSASYFRGKHKLAVFNAFLLLPAEWLQGKIFSKLHNTLRTKIVF